MKIFKTYILLGAGFYLSLNIATAQTKLPGSKVSGKVIDDGNKPMDFATITLQNATDSILIKTALTDGLGNYSFESIAAGNYRVSATVVGYKKAYSAPFSITETHLKEAVAPLTLNAQTKNLKEVSITAKKPFIEHKMDRLIVNVESSSVSAGSTAMEVLEKSPGVTIDKDDNISMKGKQGVLIMIDGKPTYMSSADVSNMLRNMQSSQIETIELITSPSAKYDAAGTSGIINIKTKKSKNAGLNGTLSAGSGYGQTSKYNGGTTLNFRKGKTNVFGNYTYANNGKKNNLNLFREVKTPDTKHGEDTITNFAQLNNWTNRRYSNSYKAGADFYINKNNTIGVLVNGYANKSNESSISNTNWDDNFLRGERIKINGDNVERYVNTAYNINYKSTLDTSGNELSVDIDYSHYKGAHNELRQNSYTAIKVTPRAQQDVNNISPAIINVKSIKADYTHPLSKVSKIEAGIKTSLVSTDNNLLLEKSKNGIFVPDPEYTNHFIYDENVYAGYLNYSKEFKKFGMQLGVRAEQTDSKGFSVTNNSTVPKHYLEFFPSMAFNHKLNKNNEVSLSYSRRIDRPSYDELNPFLNFLDEYTYQRGNPYLNPQFTNSVDLSHTYKGSITTSLNYSRTKNVMTVVTEQDDVTKKTFATQKNLDQQTVIGINLYAPIPVTKWWNINNNLQVFNMSFKSKTDGGTLDAGQFAATYNMDQSFTVNKTFSLESSMQYQSPLQYGIFKIGSQVVFNAGLKKSFKNNKLNLRFSMNDIFNGRTQRLSTTYQNMNLHFTEKQESQIGRLTLSYRFGKNEIKPARKRSTGVEDVQGRMKN